MTTLLFYANTGRSIGKKLNVKMQKALLVIVLALVSIVKSFAVDPVVVKSGDINVFLEQETTFHNVHFLGGLIDSKTVNGKNYIDGIKAYKVKHSLAFVNYLIGGI